MLIGAVKRRMKMSNPKIIKIDNIEYVRKDELKNPDTLKDYCIVRCSNSGVFAGNVVSEKGQEVTIKNARRIWYWDGAASLSQLAMEGTKKPENCKFPCEVIEIRVKDAIEILPCTENAFNSIKGVKIWSQT
jgi:hypothetical protein